MIAPSAPCGIGRRSDTDWRSERLGTIQSLRSAQNPKFCLAECPKHECARIARMMNGSDDVRTAEQPFSSCWYYVSDADSRADPICDFYVRPVGKVPQATVRTGLLKQQSTE